MSSAYDAAFMMAAGPDVGSLISSPNHRIALMNRLTVQRVFW